MVAETLGASGAGALRISPNLGLVMATSRTYATTPDGSYGQGIPGVAEGEVFAEGELGYLPGLRQDEDFRTNIGFANTGDGPVDIVVTAHAADGGEIQASSYRVEGSSWVQLNQPLPGWNRLRNRHERHTGSATYLAYASVVDRSDRRSHLHRRGPRGRMNRKDARVAKESQTTIAAAAAGAHAMARWC